MFCYLLMFLEDKEIEEQFILSTLTEYVALCFPKGEVSWNSYQCRRQLIHVLQYAVKSRHKNTTVQNLHALNTLGGDLPVSRAVSFGVALFLSDCKALATAAVRFPFRRLQKYF